MTILLRYLSKIPEISLRFDLSYFIFFNPILLNYNVNALSLINRMHFYPVTSQAIKIQVQLFLQV